MKYIIFSVDGVVEVPVVFPDVVLHQAVFGFSKCNKAVSAGYCALHDDNTFSVYGKSVGLNLESRPEDSDLLNHMLKY